MFHYRITETKYEKPKRPCPFCKTEQSQLRRHVLTKHQDEAQVQEALFYHEGSTERDNAFDKIRKDGMYRFNKEKALDRNQIMCRRGIVTLMFSVQNATASLEIACFTEIESYA
ncbi:hypothetical protein DPMN_124514 [Dreissena polymorpha]|uniref:Uncharacterized protein n=1 Tax=Dreissena polymorpha TaxID=45954 RepID=A0A9D4JTW6_DREPO|nr:hypothetical protein DPMN_124514 [Dreissena polymorpha]